MKCACISRLGLSMGPQRGITEVCLLFCRAGVNLPGCCWKMRVGGAGDSEGPAGTGVRTGTVETQLIRRSC